MTVTYELRIWRIRPLESAGDYATRRAPDETRYIDLPENVDDARMQVLARGIVKAGDTFRLERRTA